MSRESVDASSGGSGRRPPTDPTDPTPAKPEPTDPTAPGAGGAATGDADGAVNGDRRQVTARTGAAHMNLPVELRRRFDILLN